MRLHQVMHLQQVLRPQRSFLGQATAAPAAEYGHETRPQNVRIARQIKLVAEFDQAALSVSRCPPTLPIGEQVEAPVSRLDLVADGAGERPSRDLVRWCRLRGAPIGERSAEAEHRQITAPETLEHPLRACSRRQASVPRPANT